MNTEEKLDFILSELGEIRTQTLSELGEIRTQTLSELGEIRTQIAVIQTQLKGLPCSTQIMKVEGLEKELGEVKSNLNAAKFVGKIIAGTLSFMVAVLEFLRR